ncbi:germinal-center associated nuclear protein-like isoform X2 [Dendronephthya gigantea]|uniref:germinal-center associated nuclear protein-like isoform X2 n=1 Tax=Dendronephthya gigantea TaxID=151771 RepID=UPI00106BCBAF|nr:germinal-center associated nuclear protein-like isoform X2 [Dendronephthya gigantea]
MNAGEIRQKKKKQAVRRLSQGSGGPGKRRGDMRRLLEARKRDAAQSGSESGISERRLPRGIRQGHVEHPTRPYGRGIRRGLGPNRASLKRHVSPLTNSAVPPQVTAATSIPQQTTNVFSSSSATTLKLPQQENQNVFGSKNSVNQGNVFGKVDSRRSPSKSKVNHPSPLSGVTTSPSKAGGSIMSGLSNQANIESGSTASLTDKSSANLFQSAISSSGQPLDSQRNSQSQSITNVGSIFGARTGMPTTASPNVNLFEQKEKPNSETTNNLTLHSTGNTTPFSGMANVESKAPNVENKAPNVENKAPNMESNLGIFGNPLKSNTNFITSTNSNPIGSTTPSIFGSVNSNPNPVFGSVGFAQTMSQQASTPNVFGAAGFSDSNTQFTTALTANQVTNPSISSSTGSVFGAAGLPSTMKKPQNVSTDSNKVSVFGNMGTTDAGQALKPGPFTSKSTNVANQASHSPKKGGGFGNAGLPITSSAHIPKPGPFTSKSAIQTSQFPNLTGNAVNTSIPETSGQSSGVFTKKQPIKTGPFTSKTAIQTSQSTNFPTGLQSAGLSSTLSDQSQQRSVFTKEQLATKPGPFTSKSTNQTPQSPKLSGGSENAGLSSTFSGQSQQHGVFTKTAATKPGPFTSKSTNQSLSQNPQGSIFGNTAHSSASAAAGNVFSRAMSDMKKAGTNSMFSQTQRSETQSFSSGIFTKSGAAVQARSSGSVFGSQAAESQGESILTNQKGKAVNPKTVKRTLSNTDVSELTSIVVNGLTGEYFDKKLLEERFARFGTNKVSLQPSKQTAIVNFADHDSAKKAKSGAIEMFPMTLNVNVFYCKKKKGTGRTSKTPEKATTGKREYQSRKMSLSNALNSIDTSEFPSAASAQDRFTILDDVDKRIREAVTPYKDIANAPVIIGVCSDMCPEKERYMREYQANLSIFEMVPGTQDNRDGDAPKVEHAKAVKEYSRSAADKLEPLAHELRPVHVLQMTLDYLMSSVMNNSEERWEDWFNFLWNRTRAIRKDITQQHLCDVQSADLVEKITRFHIFCAHYLCEEDMHSFDPKINNENLTKCMQTLKQFYVDLYTDQKVKCPNEAEFQAYDILLNLNEGDTLRKAMQYRVEIRKSPEVKFALEVFNSLDTNNFVRFFKLLKSASYLNACIMHRYFTQVRSNALKVLTKTHSPKELFPVPVLQDLLAFGNKVETTLFCSHYNFTTNDDSVQFSKSAFIDPETALPLRRDTITIESKRDCSIGEVVNGAPLMSRAIHRPVSSFDSNGRYIGLENLAQMLRSMPDTPDLESPSYDIYESSFSAPSDQQQTVTTQAVDRRVIFNEATEKASQDLLERTVNELVKEISGDAIRQIELQRQLTKTFADEFIDKSVRNLVKEIAKECFEREVEARRQRIAMAESRARMSVVVLNEIIDEFMENELRSMARNAKMVIDQQMTAQSVTKMSAVIMREMLEHVMYEQCRDIALATRKELVGQKKAMLWKKAEILKRRRLKRYFQTWSKEYETRKHIRNILQELPATPPMLTTKQQLEKLLSNKTSTESIQKSPTTSYARILKERQDLQKLLTDRVNQLEMKRLRAMQPINLSKLHAELADSELISTKKSNSNCVKLVVSFSNRVGQFSSADIESLIKFKLRAENKENACFVPELLQEKVEQLSGVKIPLKEYEFRHDIKACYGVLSSEESRNAERYHLLRGLTGVFFVLDSDEKTRDESFWSNSRSRLRQILRSKPRVPKIPLVIMNIDSGNIDSPGSVEEILDVAELLREDLISECVVYELRRPADTDELHEQIVHALLWLMAHNPEMPSIGQDSLKGFVEKEVLKHFTIPLQEEAMLRKKALLQPQCPEVIVDLYNAVIDHVISMVTNVQLRNISWPAPEFIATEQSSDIPHVSWNSTETLERLHSVLRKLKLPMPYSPASDGTWQSESILCLDYINVLLEKEPLKTFGFALINRIERILSPYASDRSYASLTAADVPWPDVVETCINTLLSWVHTISDVKNVYYFSQDLDGFKPPTLWTQAVTETVKLIDNNSPKIRSKTSKLDDLTVQVERELTKLETSHSRLDVSESELFVDDSVEETARRFHRNLGKEKRNWKRFEEGLRSIVDEEDVQHLNLSVRGQGLKRKNPSWSSGYRIRKSNAKKDSAAELDDTLPDFNSTFSYFETSLGSLRDGLEMHRHLQKLTEKKLKEALDDDFD